MVSAYKKLCVLIWKCVLLRKRTWFLTLCELIAPIGVMFLGYTFLDNVLYEMTDDNNKYGVTFEPARSIFEVKGGLVETAWIPPSNDTNNVKNMYGKLIGYSFSMGSVKENENDLESWLYETSMYKMVMFEYLGIKLMELGNNFKYMVRSAYPTMVTVKTDTKELVKVDPYVNSGFLKTQLLIDVALMNFLGIKVQRDEAFIGKFPDIFATKPNVGNAFQQVYIFMTAAYVVFVFTIVRNVVQEKVSGIKEYMKIIGVPAWMIWLHWIMYSLIVHIPVTLIGTYIFALLRSPVIPASPIVVWLLLFLFTINCMLTIFVLTCLFNGPRIGTLIPIGAWVFGHIAGYIYFYPKDDNFAIKILFCLLPLKNIILAFFTIVSFHESGEPWTLKDMFTVGSTGSYISVGLSIIISILLMILLIIVLMFLDYMNLGPYGDVQPHTFVWRGCIALIRRLKKSDYVKSSLPKTYETPPIESKVAIEIRNVHKRYGLLNNVVAVENVDLDIYEGEIMSLLGRNGAGKTTTISMIAGTIAPSKGVIRFNGEDITKNSKYRDSLGICTQHDVYFPKLTVIEHLIFFGMLRGMTYKEAKLAGFEQLNILNMNNETNSFVAGLSDETKRRLCLAVSLTGEPKYLILDEPTSGLNPQSRREIWNIILGMRGQRTILITTNSMEEANVLSNRIAQMDHGFIVCCGSTMFIKRTYETGYRLYVLKAANASSDNILHMIRQHVEKTQMKIASSTQTEFSVPEESVKRFPGMFAALEDNRDNLGITGILVTYITMEDDFLKVADKSIGGESASGINNPKPSVTNDSYHIGGLDLFCVRYKILLWKLVRYQLSNTISMLIKVIIASIVIWLVVNMTVRERVFKTAQPPLLISLNIFKEYSSIVKYDAESESIADAATHILKKHNWKVETLSHSSNLTSFLIDLFLNDYTRFSNMLLALEIINGKIKIYYQNRLHLSAITANLITNLILIKSTSNNSSIEIINYPYVHKAGLCEGNFSKIADDNAFKWMCVFFFGLLILMTNIIPLLTVERVSGFKHQQTLAGVTPILYWMANFTYHYCLYLCIIFIYVIIVTAVGGKVLIESGLIEWLVLVLLLYGISGTFFVYLFTFFIDNTVISLLLFTLGNVCLVIVPSIMFDHTYHNIHTILSLNPLFAVSIAINQISTRISYAYSCNICDIQVSCSKLQKSLFVIPDSRDVLGIRLYVLFLGVSWLVYFGIILIFDTGCVRSILLRLFYRQNKYNTQEESDDDVKGENDLLRILKERNDQHTPLRVDGISKKYLCGPRAVSKMSFVVIPGECFGLLGGNGAGKSTALKILTGDILPNRGDAIILDQSLISSRRKYQSYIGYCPQVNPFLDNFTGEEIITTIGRLRGIPRKDLKRNVDDWVKIMGISEHMNKHSGSYSNSTKRKLSTAMAFIGNPVVVFLDEPTSGVDPESRLRLWTVMKSRQNAGQAIVFTSRSMTECEALSTRLTIMRNGQMMCIGSPEYLKNKFTHCYNVLVKLESPSDTKTSELKKAFEESFPNSVIVDEHAVQVNYQIRDPELSLSRLFTIMLQFKSKYDIVEDFSVSNTSMEQLFSSFAKKKKHSR